MITVRRIFAAASLALCMTAFNACVKEEAPEQLPVADENLVEITFEAPSVGVKSTFDGDARKINWELTDKVAVYDGTARRQFSVTAIENGTATLKGYVADDATEFYAVYPYSAAGEELPVDGAVNINVPHEQTLAEGKNFDEDAFVTVGKVEDGNIAFKNVVSLLKLNIPADVKSVKLISYSTEMFAGAATAKTDRTTTAGDKASIVLKPSAATFTAGEHYIALLPTTFDKGFRVVYEQASQLGVSKTTSEVVFPVNGGQSITGSTPSWIPTVIMNETQLRNYFANQDLFGATEVKLGQNIALTSAWTPVTLTGKLDGQNYTISGVNVSAKYNAGFFAAVKTGAFVKDLTIEGTIKALKPTSAAKSYVGVAGFVSGTMENVTNKASITLEDGIEYQALVGGITGNVLSGGVVKKCVNNGSITVDGTGAENWYVGGIAGYVGDPSGAGWSNNAAGTVDQCINEGALTVNNDRVEAIGGIVGMFRGGSISACENKGSITVTKTLANGNLGGIAGYVQNRSGKKATISGCTNNAVLDFTGSATTLANISGIIGLSNRQNYEVEVSGCYNKKAISVSSTSKVYIGGIVATYSGDGTALFKFSDCHNQAAVSCVNLSSTTAYLGVDTYLGGLAGCAQRTTTFEGCTNTGSVSCDRLSKNYIGGLVGCALGTTNILSSANSGAVTADPASTVSTDNYVGGLVGYANGTLTVTSNENNATSVTLAASGGTVTVGGLIGFTYDNSNVTISSNKNRASVLLDTKSAYCPAGGVVGMVKGNMTSSDNINFGDVELKTTHASVEETHCGGIVGLFNMGGSSATQGTKTASLLRDKSFGHIKSVGKIGLLFASSAYNNYGKVTITDCVVGGYVTGICGGGATINRDNTEITKDNFAQNLWSYYKTEDADGNPVTTFVHEGTVFGEASTYDK